MVVLGVWFLQHRIRKTLQKYGKKSLATITGKRTFTTHSKNGTAIHRVVTFTCTAKDHKGQKFKMTITDYELLDIAKWNSLDIGSQEYIRYNPKNIKSFSFEYEVDRDIACGVKCCRIFFGIILGIWFLGAFLVGLAYTFFSKEYETAFGIFAGFLFFGYLVVFKCPSCVENSNISIEPYTKEMDIESTAVPKAKQQHHHNLEDPPGYEAAQL
jgi:hypothetical protein